MLHELVVLTDCKRGLGGGDKELSVGKVLVTGEVTVLAFGLISLRSHNMNEL